MTEEREAPAGMSQSDERLWATFCHLAALAMFAVPFGSIIGPLVVWLLKKDESAYVDRHGKAALNFHISLAIYFFVGVGLMVVVGLPLTLLLVGFALIFVLAALLGALKLLALVCIVVAAVKANRGEFFRYPLAIPFFQ